MDTGWLILGWVVAVSLALLGLVGTILPMLPGVPLVFGGLFLAAWLGDFQRVGAGTLTLLGIMALLALAIDLLASALGARRVGASRLALLGAGVGSILGLFGGLVGLLVLPFVGAVVGELLAQRSLGQAGRAGFATWLGLMLGSVAKLAIALSMVGVFALAYWWK